jgi:hypothetical protein
VPETHQAGDLSLIQDPEFQRRMWTVQRVAWAVMALTVGAAVAGLFGAGLFSQTTAGDPGAPMQIRYSRFARLLAPEELRVRVNAGASASPFVRVWLSRGYLDQIQLERIIPEPESSEAGADRVVFLFRLLEPSRGATLVFQMRLQSSGILSGDAGFESAPPVRLRHFVCP